MPKASPIQTSFNAGKLSKRLEGRVDLAKYANGCRVLQNIIPQIQGAAEKRPGTRYVADANQGPNPGSTPFSHVRLIPFEFSTDDAYILEFTHLEMRVYRDSGRVLAATHLFGGAAQVFPDTDEIKIEGGHFYIDEQGTFRLTNEGGIPGGLAIDTDYYIKTTADVERFQVSLTAGGAAVNITTVGVAVSFFPFPNSPVTLATPITQVITPYVGDISPSDAPSSEIYEMQFTQSADIMYIAHKNHAPMKLSRTDHDQWLLEEIDFNWQPFSTENLDEDIDVICDVETGSGKLFASSKIFVLADVGGHFKLRVAIDGKYPEWLAGGDGFITWNPETSAVGARFRNEANIYEIVDTPGPTAGLVPPVHRIGTETDGKIYNKFLHSGAGYVKIDSFVSQFEVNVTVIKQLPRGTVDTARGITNITQTAGPAGGRVTTSGNHGYETGDKIWITDVTVMLEVNDVRYTITRVTDTTFDLNVATDGFDAYGAGGNAYQMRTSDGSTAANRLTKHNDLWSFGAWSPNRGFPRTVNFYEDRLWFAGSGFDPQTLWASRTGDYENHETLDLDDSALVFTLNTDKVNVIEWISPGKVLAIGTAGGEFIASASSLEEALTPTNLRIVRHSTLGSRAGVMPLRIEQIALFVSRSGGRIRELVFDFDTDSFVAPDLTVLADDLFHQTVPTTPTASALDKVGAPRVMAFQQEPNRTVWVVLDSGDLLSMTYDRAQDVVAWHTHQIGNLGWSVLSVAVIPHPLGDSDQVWLVVRTGSTAAAVNHIVFLEKPWISPRDLEDAFYVDSGLTYDPDPAATTSTPDGLDHLDGLTVQVLADGTRRDDEVVASGTITISGAAANVIQVGIGYDAILQTMRLEAGAADGTAQGKLKRITRFVVRLFQTGVGLKYGAEDDSKLENVPQAAAASSADLKDGDTPALAWPKGYEQAGRILLKHSTPLPCTITAIMPQVVTQDR